MTFDLDAAQQFLAEPQVGVFSVAAPAGPPASVPLWYSYRIGGRVWIVTKNSTRKARLVSHTRMATLVVDAVTPRTRYVSVELRLIDAQPPTVEDIEKLASPHLSKDNLTAFIEFIRNNIDHERKMTFEVTKWRFADLTRS